MNTKFTNHKDRLTKWLLTVTLLFNIFTFSAYAGNSQSRQQQTAQTELVISNNHKTCERTISFQKALEFCSFNDFIINPDKNWTNALFAYNHLTKVKLDNNSRQFYSHKHTDNFLQVKTIPQSSDENTFVIFIG